MIIALPSRGRPSFPASNFLKSYPRDVFVFVDPSDYETYLKNNPNNFNIVGLKEGKGLYYALNCILEFVNERFMLIDDDVQDIYVRNGLTKGGYPKLIKLNNLQEMFADVRMVMDNFDLAILHLRQNHYNWMSKELELATEGGYHVSFVDKEKIAKIKYDESIRLHSDTDFYIQVCKAGLRMATYYKYAYTSQSLKIDKQGGCYHLKDNTKEDAMSVIDKWKSPYIKIKQDKITGRWGVVAKWKKLCPIKYWEKICV